MLPLRICHLAIPIPLLEVCMMFDTWTYSGTLEPRYNEGLKDW